jgi:hypothetical protein
MITAIEAECLEKTGLKGEVVTLYQGGQYHLYRYKRFTDIRLVFAPEERIANFGGDTDNFEFPRFCMDFAFFRIYENDQPFRPEHWLKWSGEGAKDGDLAIVFGHPGKTQRLNTVDHLKFLRDVQVPASLRYLNRAGGRLAGIHGPERRERVVCGRGARRCRELAQGVHGSNGRAAGSGVDEAQGGGGRQAQRGREGRGERDGSRGTASRRRWMATARFTSGITC